MDRLAIEINGAGLLIADAKTVLASEPGYAFVDESSIATGLAAYNQTRLYPAKARIGFWSGLRIDDGGMQNNAELAYEHLRQLWQQVGRDSARAILVVPGGYDAEQLGLVLGIAQECGIRVDAMIDTAVAASELRYEGAQLFYVDASLRSASVTRLEQAGGASVDRCETLRGLGLADLYDETVRAIARVFVMETRFDPLHGAETEQALYDGLPDWLEGLHRDGAVKAQVQHAGDTVAVELSVERIRSASLRLFREIARMIRELRTPGVPAVIELNARLAKLPGLSAELKRMEGIVLNELEPGFPARSALARTPELEVADDHVRLLRRLPFVGDGQLPAVASVSANPPQAVADLPPTHVVFDGIGYRLDRGRIEVTNVQPARSVNGTRTISIGGAGETEVVTHCVLQFENGLPAVARSSDTTLRVNDVVVAASQRLAAGDVIRVGELQAELQVVALEE
jgi:hypothetical protein